MGTRNQRARNTITLSASWQLIFLWLETRLTALLLASLCNGVELQPLVHVEPSMYIISYNSLSTGEVEDGLDTEYGTG